MKKLLILCVLSCAACALPEPNVDSELSRADAVFVAPDVGEMHSDPGWEIERAPTAAPVLVAAPAQVLEPQGPAWVADVRGMLYDELRYLGHRVRDVSDVVVKQAPVAEISAMRGSAPTYGLWDAVSRTVWVGDGDLCDSPPDYDGRLVGWVLGHELAHAVGWAHGPEMSEITEGLYVRVRAHCGTLDGWELEQAQVRGIL